MPPILTECSSAKLTGTKVGWFLEQIETKLKILGFAGSLRVGSYNKALLRAAADLLADDTILAPRTGHKLENTDTHCTRSLKIVLWLMFVSALLS